MKKIVFVSALAPVAVLFGFVIFHNLIVSMALFYGGVCLLIPFVDLFFIKKNSVKVTFHKIGFKNIDRAFVPGIGLGIVFFIVIVLFFAFFHEWIFDIQHFRTESLLAQVESRYSVFIFLILVLLNSFLEESLWRGYVFYKLLQERSIRFTIVFTAAFYASYHLITAVKLFSVFTGIFFMIVVFIAGLIWGSMRYKYDSIYGSFLSHLCADLAIMLIYLKYIV